ncbi:uncharacterized protein LOC134197606 [Corticium candelabrum]|uniref:uncharacterized protein LOC134197606 n=1 Tax=Corticium candelabrum TaxID=121492 RepID=UPI002E25C021|nr:uncharacterized protein LOC134197606 [Corticium candelabrum]
MHVNLMYNFRFLQPLRHRKPTSLKSSLSDDEVYEANRLRRNDPSLWTVNTLARMFNVKPVIISRLTRIPNERKQELDDLTKRLFYMKPYKRHKYKSELEKSRQERLRQALHMRQQVTKKNELPIDQNETSD